MIIVIIILGIVSAVSIVKLSDLHSDARVAKLEELKGALASATHIEYSRSALAATESTIDTLLTISDTEDFYTCFGYPNVGTGKNGVVPGNAFSLIDIGLWLYGVDISYYDSADNSSDWYLETKGKGTPATIIFYPQDFYASEQDNSDKKMQCNLY